MEILRQYYETLGIIPGVPFEQIKQAYKDSVNNPRLKEKAQEKIKEINAAYEKLSIFFREYGAPNFENAHRQQSQVSSNNTYTKPPIQPEEYVHSKQKKYNYELKEAIWNPNVAAAWSLILTPAFGSFLLVLNWKVLGQPDKALKAKKWFYISLVVPILCFLIILVDNIYEAAFFANLIAFIWLITWYFAFVREQVKYIKDKYSVTYHRKTWGYALLGGGIAFFAYLIIFFVIALAHGEPQSTSAAVTPQSYIQTNQPSSTSNYSIPSQRYNSQYSTPQPATQSPQIIYRQSTPAYSGIPSRDRIDRNMRIMTGEATSADIIDKKLDEIENKLDRINR